MNQLNEFITDLEVLEKTFYKIAANIDEMEIYGLRYMSRWLDLDMLLPCLEGFTENVTHLTRVSEIVDSKIYKSIDSILEETKIEDVISRFKVRIHISLNGRNISLLRPLYILIRAISKAFGVSKQVTLFSNINAEIEDLLSAINRLKNQVKLLLKTYESYKDNDDEIFKPSNLDIRFITKEIDAAIVQVSASSDLNAEQKTKLNQYLNEAKTELTKTAPSWRKIIGALMIASTLIGGVNDLPGAVDNIKNAIAHIIGKGVYKEQSKELALPTVENHVEAPQSI